MNFLVSKLAGLRVLCGETVTNCLPMHLIFNNGNANEDEEIEKNSSHQTQSYQENPYSKDMSSFPPTSAYTGTTTAMSMSTTTTTTPSAMNSSNSSSNVTSSGKISLTGGEHDNEEEQKFGGADGGWGEPAELSNWGSVEVPAENSAQQSSAAVYVDPFANLQPASVPAATEESKPKNKKKPQSQKLGMMDEDKIQKKVEEKTDEKDEIDYFSQMDMGVQASSLFGKKENIKKPAVVAKPVAVVVPEPVVINVEKEETVAQTIFNKEEETTQEELEAANNWGDEEIDL